MTRRDPRSGLCFIALLVLAQTASAAILVPVSQDRRAQASATVYPLGGGSAVQDSETVTAPDFGAFQDSASAYAEVEDLIASATAGHSSTIGDEGIFASGGGSVYTAGPAFPLGDNALVSGSARFELTFDLLVPVDYQLDAYFDAVYYEEEFNTPGGSVTLRDSSGVSIFSSGLPPQERSWSDHQVGTLAPGRYTFLAGAGASGEYFFGGTQSVSFGLDFYITAIPEPSTLCLVSVGLLGFTARRRLRAGRDRHRVTEQG